MVVPSAVLKVVQLAELLVDPMVVMTAVMKDGLTVEMKAESLVCYWVEPKADLKVYSMAVHLVVTMVECLVVNLDVMKVESLVDPRVDE
jgi:hypothetical protein